MTTPNHAGPTRGAPGVTAHRGAGSEAPDIDPEPPTWQTPTVLRQRWEELAYFHWAYDIEEVQSLLPPGVQVNTFDGAAWVGLIPFEMRGVRLGPTPAVPWLGRFIEINVRTYVRDPHGRRAVWFFSLDVPRAAIVSVARSVFALPYCWSTAHHEVDGSHHHYRMERRWPHGRDRRADMTFTVGAPLQADEVTPLDHFLTARWALLTQRRGRLRYGRVHHPRWPLHRVSAAAIHQDVLQAAGLPAPAGDPHARFSPGVPVRIGWFEEVAIPTGVNDLRTAVASALTAACSGRPRSGRIPSPTPRWVPGPRPMPGAPGACDRARRRSSGCRTPPAVAAAVRTP